MSAFVATQVTSRKATGRHSQHDERAEMMIIRLTAQQASLLHTEKAMSFRGRSSNDSIESSSPDKDCALIGKVGNGLLRSSIAIL